MSAHVERIKQQHSGRIFAYHKDLLFTAVNLFKNKLLDDLVLFNTEGPHYGLGLKSPCEFLQEHHQCSIYSRNGEGFSMQEA